VLITALGILANAKHTLQWLGMSNRVTPYEELPEYLTPEELQTYLGLSRNTVYELLRRNEIPHVRFGRSIRLPKAALRQPAAAASAAR
jgi:excisionase family DNA binding protein